MHIKMHLVRLLSAFCFVNEALQKGVIFSVVLRFQDEKKSDGTDSIYKRKRRFFYLEEVC